MNDIFSIAGKVAVITGGSGVLGSNIARGFLRAGAKVLIIGAHQESVDSALANLKSVVATITPAIEFLNAFDGNYTQHDTDKIFTTLNSYADIEIAGSSESQTTTVEELDMFLKVYAYYQNDLECFYTSLENVNFREFQNSNFDPQVYAKDDAQKFAYASKILSFTNQSVLNLYEINIALCN